jgi:hypothetical protein
MEHLDIERVREQLQTLVNPAWGERFELRREFSDGGITGYLVRKNWRGVAIPVRQKELGDWLKDRFGDLSSDVSLILTFTPEEFAPWYEDREQIA